MIGWQWGGLSTLTGSGFGLGRRGWSELVRKVLLYHIFPAFSGLPSRTFGMIPLSFMRTCRCARRARIILRRGKLYSLGYIRHYALFPYSRYRLRKTKATTLMFDGWLFGINRKDIRKEPVIFGVTLSLSPLFCPLSPFIPLSFLPL